MDANQDVAVAAARAALDAVRVRIDVACGRVDRDPESVVLVGASKTHPAEHLAAFYRAGLRTFGENRVQETEEKKPLLPRDADWHLLGPLQSNKARRALELFSTIHSLDRLKIARALAKEAAVGPIRCFVEVNVGEETSKHGFEIAVLEDAVAEMLELRGLEIAGLMAIPPPQVAPESARPWFRKLRALSETLRGRWPKSFGAGLSMGMSGDFEVAIEEGATHVRIGSALFGQRAPS
jgi:hypothetical protein